MTGRVSGRVHGHPVLRRYRPGDRPHVEQLLRTGLAEQMRYAAACDPPEDEGFLTSEMAEHVASLGSEPERWWVAETGAGDVVGCMWLRSLVDRLGAYHSVRQIIVAPDQRDRGSGARLLDHAEAISRESGAVMLLISGMRPNPAIRLYRRCGFEEFPRAYREDPNPNHVVLWKNFGVADYSDGQRRSNVSMKDL